MSYNRERIGNEELLTYQLQKMREKCSLLESKQTEMDRLVVENQVTVSGAVHTSIWC